MSSSIPAGGAFWTTEYGKALRAQRKENARVRRVLRRTGGNAAQTARETGVGVKRVTRIKHQAGIKLEPAKKPRVSGKRETEKAAVREALEAGTPVKRIARELGTPESTVRLWRNRWGLSGQPAP